MASGVMHIRYGSENIGSAASRAVRELSSVSSKLDNVRDRILDLPERSRSGDNLSRASSFLRKKQQETERRQDALEVLKTRCNTFMSHVETTEKRLSNSIRHDYKKFHKETGIGKTAAAAFFEELTKAAVKVLNWLNPVTRAKAAWDTVKDIASAISDWYNNGGGKYVVDMFLKAAGAVFAVVAVLTAPITGPIALVCAVAAAIIAIDATLDFIKSAVVVGQYYSGNEEKARELSSQGVGEFLFGPDTALSKAYNFVVGAACAIDLASSAFKAISKLGTIAKTATGTGFAKFKNIVTGYGKEVFGKNIIKLKDTIKTNGLGKSIKLIFTMPIPKVAGEIKGFKKAVYDPYKFITTLPKIFKNNGAYKNTRNWRTVLKFAM